MNTNTTRDNKGVDAPFTSVGFVTEHRMTKAELNTLREVVVAYMTTHEVSVESAVMDLIDIDGRFGGGFECSEIAIIMGSNKHEIKRVEGVALRKIKNPKNGGGQALKAYFSIEDSDYESDF